MRLVLAVSALVLVAGASAEQGSGRGGAIGAPTGPDPTHVGIYVATFRSLAETEHWFDPVLLDERICPDIADIRTPQQALCPERFTEAEQAVILAGLADLPGIRFVDDAEHIQDRIFSGGLQGAGLLTVAASTGATSASP
jgi:hypothetical protein